MVLDRKAGTRVPRVARALAAQIAEKAREGARLKTKDNDKVPLPKAVAKQMLLAVVAT